MKTNLLFCFCFLPLLYCLAGTPDKAATTNMMAKQPLLFMENKGQITDEKGNKRKDILFTIRDKGIQLFISRKGINYQFKRLDNGAEINAWRNKHDDKKNTQTFHDEKDMPPTAKFTQYNMQMELLGANPKAKVETNISNSYYENYYNVPHEPEGVTNVHSFEKITIKNIYPGIDWVLYINKNNKLEYDFELQPGADPALISMKYSGADSILLSENGEVKITTPLGNIKQSMPVTYLNKDKNERVECSYLVSDNIISFKASMNVASLVTIDPVVEWGTYLGGNNPENVGDLYLDRDLFLFICGQTNSTNNIADSNGFQQIKNVGEDGFVTKYNLNNVKLWSTYYGGNGNDDFATNILTDQNGNVFLSGRTYSDNIGGNYNICTLGAHQTQYGGGSDVFLVKFNPDGIRQWGTYYGGNAADGVISMVIDNLGFIYLGGYTASTSNIANVIGYFQTYGGNQDGFLSKFDNLNGFLVWSTYYGGASEDIVTKIQIEGNSVIISGNTASVNRIADTDPSHQTVYGGGASDGFIAKFYGPGGNRDWGTYLGGNDVDEINDMCSGYGSIFLAGRTWSTDLNTINALQSANGGFDDGFLVNLNLAGGNIVWSTYLGGPSDDYFNAICLSQDSSIYLAGITNTFFGIDTITFGTGFQTSISNLFLTKFNNNGIYNWGTYYGGSGFNDLIYKITIGNKNTIQIIGQTNSFNNISFNGFQDLLGGSQDGFIAKFDNNGNRIWGSYIGGTDIDFGQFAVIDNKGSNYISGLTLSLDSISTINGNQFIYGGNGDAFIIKINCFPEIPALLTEDSMLVCQGTSPIFLVNAGDSVIWMKGNTIKQADTSLTFQINNVQPSDAGLYTIILRTNDGCEETLYAYLGLYPSATVSATITGNDTVLCVGETINLNCSHSAGSFTFIWQGPSGWSDNISNPVPFLANNTNQQGYYSITLTDGNGCNVKDSMFIKINPIPVIQSVNLLTDSVCANSPATLSFDFTNGTGPWSYNWYNLNTGNVVCTGTPSNTGTIICNFTPTNNSFNGSYYMSIMDANGCSATSNNTSSLTVLDQASISLSIDSIHVCEGGTVSVNVNTNAPNTIWTDPNGGLITLPFTTNANTLNGNYICTVSGSNVCPNSSTLNLIVDHPPVDNIASPTDSVCINQPFTICTSAPNSAYSYSWVGNIIGQTDTSCIQPNTTIPGNSIFTVTISQGLCSINDVKTLTVNEKPDLGIFTGIPSGCEGSSINITYQATNGGGFYSYLWTDSHGNFGDSTNIITIPSAVLSNSGLYTMYVEDINHCKDTLATNVTIFSNPVINSISTNDTLCLNDMLTITSNVDTGNGPVFQYHWSINNFNFQLSQNFFSTDTLSSGNHNCSLIVIDGHNCSDTLTTPISFNIYDLPDVESVSFMPNASNACFGSQNLGLGISCDSAWTFLWSGMNLGNDIDPTSCNIVLDIPNSSANPFTVILEVTDIRGCKKSKIISISLPDSINSNGIIVKKKPSGANYATLMVLDNTAQFYQWGYDAKDVNRTPFELKDENFQTLFLPIDSTNLLDYWVELTNVNNCKTKIYYSGPYSVGKPIVWTEPSGPFELNIHPNPSNGQVELMLMGDYTGALEINLFNQLGQKQSQTLITKTITDQAFNLDWSSLPAGLYFLQVNSGDGNKMYRKIEIIH